MMLQDGKKEWVNASIPTLGVGKMGMFSWLFTSLMLKESYILVAKEAEIFQMKYNQTF